MLAALMGLAERMENKQILTDGGIPHFMYPELAIKTLAAMYRFRQWIDMPEDISKRFQVDSKKVESVLANARREGSIYILEDKGYEILSAYGFRTVKRILATSEDECIKVAKEIGYPIVMKIVSPDIIHKSDAGGVKVGLRTEDEIRAAFNNN